MVLFNWSQLLHIGVVTIASLPNAVEALKPGSQWRNSADRIPGAYIVEFEDATSTPGGLYAQIQENHNIDVIHRRAFNYRLFKGASFEIPKSHDNDTTIKSINDMPMVKQIWPIGLRHRIDPEAVSSSGIASGLVKRTSSDTYPPHVMGGVSKLHDEGFMGEGMTAVILDTGIDYTHQALGGGFGPGFKVAFGYDLVGDKYDGSNESDLAPGPDPMDCGGHGTHVAGIFGADANNPYGIIGVAPKATIGIFRVFGCKGSTSEDVLVDAFNRAFEASPDVISASLGVQNGWPERASDVMVSRIVAAGTPCTIAAGNSGGDGLFQTESAAEGRGVTSIGSIDNTIQPAILVTASYSTSSDPVNKEFGYFAGTFGDFGNGTYPVYAISLDPKVVGDACKALPEDTPDLSKYVVLVRRGICTYSEKIENVIKKGGQRMILYNRRPGEPVSPVSDNETFPCGMVRDTIGESWVSTLAAGGNVTLTFTAIDVAPVEFETSVNEITGGYMSDFTSIGPTYDLDIKPQVSGPGGYIISTYPVKRGSYAVISGTSMATPFLAGCVALIKQVRGKSSSPSLITSLMTTTAKPVDWNDGEKTTPGLLAPVIQQGGGLVDAYTAAKTTTIISTSALQFNDTDHFVQKNPFTITNSGPDTVSYYFGSKGAATAYALNESSILPQQFPPEVIPNYASLTFSPENVTILPGENAEITAMLTPPTGLNPDRLPLYSGFVQINGTNGDCLNLPYAGLVGSMIKVQLMNTEQGFPLLTNLTGRNESDIKTSSNSSVPVFIIPKANLTGADNTTSYPLITWNLAMGTRLLRCDIVPANTASPCYGSSCPQNTNGTKNILGVDVLGSMLDYPYTFLARGYNNSDVFTGQLDDASFVPAGRYSLLLRALKIFGDDTNPDDYESYMTDVIEIQYKE